MMAFALCLALATSRPAPDGAEVLRGCGIATHTQAAAVAYDIPPTLLLAIAQQETRIRAVTNKGGYCGQFQVHPRWAAPATCADLQGEQGPWAAARLLAAYSTRGGVQEALRRYSGSAPGSHWYARQVLTRKRILDRAMPWTDHKHAAKDRT